jgi:hypothetical protein
MTKEDYVSFEVAKLLNAKGFKGEFHKYYWGYEPGKEILTDGSFDPEYDYPAPTLQMAMKWLREEHKIAINIGWDEVFEENFQWWCIILSQNSGKILRESEYCKTYEEACEAAIKYCLENLI